MSTDNKSMPEFSKIRTLLWPIHKHEKKRFLSLAFIMSCILFNYTVCRNTKDTLMVTSAGAGTITFLKLYFVTPAAVIFLLLFTKLSNILNRENLFYALMVPFLVFFFCFGVFLNPNIAYFHPSPERIEAMIVAHPSLTAFIKIYGNWVYALFFIMSELWGTVILSLAFWGFVNQTTPMKQAKRFYGMFAVTGNLSLVFCGYAVSYASMATKNFLPVGSSEALCWQWTVNVLMMLVVFVGCVALAVFKYLHISVLNKEEVPVVDSAKKKKKKPGLLESLKIVFTSKDLGLIVMLVISYGVTINLVEVQWKNQVALHFATDKAAMNAFFGKYSTWTGAVTVVFAWFFGSSILRKFGWLVSALFTPLVIFATGTLFFLLIFGTKHFKEFLSIFTNNPAYFATIVGAVVVISSKASKYCLFDPTKEMAYIPLDDELKSKGKAAVDVVGGRLGKSGGAFVQSTLLLLMGTTDVTRISDISFIAFVVMSVLWLGSVKSLSKRLDEYEVKNKN